MRPDGGAQGEGEFGTEVKYHQYRIYSRCICNTILPDEKEVVLLEWLKAAGMVW